MRFFGWFRRRQLPPKPRPQSAWQDQADSVRALMDAFAPPPTPPLNVDKPEQDEKTPEQDDHKP